MNRYKITEGQYEGLHALQRFYGKRLSSSNISTSRKKLYKKCISFMQRIKEKGFYDKHERTSLNRMRDDFLNTIKKPMPH